MIQDRPVVVLPSVIQVGLVPALRSLTDGLRPALHVELQTERGVRELDSPVDSALSESVRLTLYRAAEEALGNVVRHARTERAWVWLRVVGAALEMVVHDEGRGFEPTESSRGLGLRSAAERVEAVGGKLSVLSAPDRGTSIVARVPLAQREPLGRWEGQRAPA